MKLLFTLLFVVYSLTSGIAQQCADLNLTLRHEIPTACSAISMTMLHDRLDRPYLYVANKEDGLKIYDISNIASPQAVAQITVNDWGGGHAMNLSQEGNTLVMATGNTFTTGEQAGMAIIDVSDPQNPIMKGAYHLAGSSGGAGIALISGNYAYLGAMGAGVVILDITNPAAIIEKAVFKPDINFPDAAADPAKVNARGMEIRNDTLFLCYDAGGLRIINVSNKTTPVEVGRYANPALNGLPRAYNNVVLAGKLAYVAVDYCGLEVLDISDPANIQLHGWWNPYNCPANNWFSSPVHANEIKLNAACTEIFLSTGKSDMMVIDVSNPAQPDSCNYYGGVNNSIGSWGIDVWNNYVSLSYVCAIIPFSSFWSGVKTLEMTLCGTGLDEEDFSSSVRISPNPSAGAIEITTKLPMQQIRLYDLRGNCLRNIPVQGLTQFQPDLSGMVAGTYFLEIIGSEKNYLKKIVLTP